MEDCIIIGGGPAGLTAGIYLGRFLRRTLLIDGGASRAALIPCTRNLAGFPDGISGTDLLDRMGRQLAKYDVERLRSKARSVRKEGETFIVTSDEGERRAPILVLATGVKNQPPPMDQSDHDAAVAAGLLRYCPVCDAYEVRDLDVGVIGSGQHGLAEARFLRHYTDRVTLIQPSATTLDPTPLGDADAAGITCLTAPLTRIQADCAGGSVTLHLSDGASHRFDTVYAGLGTTPHSAFAGTLGAKLVGGNCIHVDAHCETTVPGLFAIGDVILGLDQISHAMGQAGVAATEIHNRLRNRG